MQNGTKKRKNGIDTYQRILKISSELFARNGFDGVSVYDIAKGCGIGESSLYNHFKSKTEILDHLFEYYMREIPLSRPSDAELKERLDTMSPEELLMQILLSASPKISGLLADTAMIINKEKYRNPKAADLYYRYVVEEPTRFYEKLFTEMKQRGKIADIDVRAFAEQYHYVCMTLTKEYYMMQNGFTNMQALMGKFYKTIHFFCGLMK
ncbi:MAG: TetR/AcrR family transcriptional regulator [Anaerofustis sp.]